MKTAVCLMGPTASGKTALAVELAGRGRFEIVSVDSALIYRGMDIGTAKPDRQTLAMAPHRLIDLCDPAEAYSAARFREDCLNAMEAIHANGRIPLLTGGTMMYFRALEFGLSELPRADERLRARLLREATQSGWAALHDRLRQVDARAAERIHPNDPQRIQRALEVWELTGRPLSELQAAGRRPATDWMLLKFARAPRHRELLRQRIATRFHAMLAQGFEAEVRALYRRGDLHAELPSMRCVGYRQMWQYLDGELDRDAMIERGIIATRQLAKRQLTWLRSYPGVVWLWDDDAPGHAGRVRAAIGEASGVSR